LCAFDNAVVVTRVLRLILTGGVALSSIVLFVVGANAAQETRDGERIIEIRVYTLKTGVRDSFHERFVRESLPMLRRQGVDVVAYGPSVDDAVSYFLVRSFASLVERTRSEDRLYNSEEWKNGPREAVLAAIETYSTVVVHADSGTVKALRHLVRDAPLGVRKERSPMTEVLDGATAIAADVTTLLALNEDYIRSVQIANVQRFRELLADDFMCSLPDGSHLDRDAFLKHVAAPAEISDLQAHDVQVRVMGDFALIHARTTFNRAGRQGASRYTDAWARRDGRWVAIAAQVTRY
jgi:ketosteroid isomerase-like protein